MQAAQRIAQLAPCPVEDGGAAGGQLAGRGAIGMVAQHGIAERGAQLRGRGGGFGAKHLVVVALLGACLAIDGHPARIRRPSPRRPSGRDGRLRRDMPPTERSGGPRAGHLLIIGGAEDKLRQRQILSRFASLAGGADARVAVISTASSLGDEATELYQSLFRSLGIPEVRGLRPADPRGRQPAGGDRGGPRRDRHLHDRRQPAAPVERDRRDRARTGDHRSAQARRDRGRHQRRRLGHQHPHGRLRHQRHDARSSA